MRLLIYLPERGNWDTICKITSLLKFIVDMHLLSFIIYLEILYVQRTCNYEIPKPNVIYC